MHTTSPIRRYVLLRQGGRAATGSSWSMERIAPAPRGTADVPAAERRAKSAGTRA